MEGDEQKRLENLRKERRSPDERDRQVIEFMKLVSLGIIPTVKFIKLRDDVELPKRAHVSDEGADLTIIREDQRISDTVWRYGTGLKVADITHGHYLEIHARSSLPKYGLCLANGVGIIDQGYRGEILVQLLKIDPSAPWPTLPFSAVQILVKKKTVAIFKEVKEDEATATDRGEGGFGSTRADQGEGAKFYFLKKK